MATVARDLITVDLRGLKAALVARAQADRVKPSDLVRRLLAETLHADRPADRHVDLARPAVAGRVRLSIRLDLSQARVVVEAARGADLSVGDYLASVVNGLPIVATPTSAAQHQAALVASSAQLATLSRNLRHLTDLLRQGSVQAAAEYRQVLDQADAKIREHLLAAGEVLKDTRPQRRRADAARRHPTDPDKGASHGHRT